MRGIENDISKLRTREPVIPGKTCGHCGGPIPASRGGKYASHKVKYCCDTCCQAETARAWRRRNAKPKRRGRPPANAS